MSGGKRPQNGSRGAGNGARTETAMTEKDGSGKIRKCGEQDILRTAAFYDRVVLYLDSHINYPRWIRHVYPSERSVREMTETGAQYLCTRDEAIVGAFALNADPQGAYREGKWKRSLPEGSYLVLHALTVDPDRQREGIGSEILRFAAGRARSEGYRAVRADIVPENLPARRLFEMNGFTHAGDADLRRNIGDVPLFSLYELNW